MHSHSEELVRQVSANAQFLRICALKMVFGAKSGHLGGAFSVAEIIASLYSHHLVVDPARPDWPERDRLLFSKGHACAVLYAALATRGFFPVAELATFRRIDSRLQGHPDREKVPGVEMCGGPLGHGIAIGCGMALALRMRAQARGSGSTPSDGASHVRVYVVIGDGEMNAGVVWEGAMTAAKYRLGNLVAILDCNGVQQTGATADVMPMEPIDRKWESFGWYTQQIDGHDVRKVLDALDRADEVPDRPSIVIAHTTKGKGVSFMENDYRWHGQVPDDRQYKQALAELEEGATKWL